MGSKLSCGKYHSWLLSTVKVCSILPVKVGSPATSPVWGFCCLVWQLSWILTIASQPRGGSCLYKLSEAQNHRKLSLTALRSEAGEEKMTTKACSAVLCCSPCIPFCCWSVMSVSGVSVLSLGFFPPLPASTHPGEQWRHPALDISQFHLCWKECACSTSRCIVTIPGSLLL